MLVDVYLLHNGKFLCMVILKSPQFDYDGWISLLLGLILGWFKKFKDSEYQQLKEIIIENNILPRNRKQISGSAHLVKYIWVENTLNLLHSKTAVHKSIEKVNLINRKIFLLIIIMLARICMQKGNENWWYWYLTTKIKSPCSSFRASDV